MFHVTAFFQSVSIFFKSAGTKSIEKLNAGGLPTHVIYIESRCIDGCLNNSHVSFGTVRKRKWNSWHILNKIINLGCPLIKIHSPYLPQTPGFTDGQDSNLREELGP